MKPSQELAEKDLDFDIVKETWCKYELSDGAYLKFRNILLRAKKNPAIKGKQAYGIEGMKLAAAYRIPPNLMSAPNRLPVSPEELDKSRKEELTFTILCEDWNEYLVEDGTAIKTKTNLVDVYRTDKADVFGRPIYITHENMITNIKTRE